jgi:hypothetical protein
MWFKRQTTIVRVWKMRFLLGKIHHFLVVVLVDLPRSDYDTSDLCDGEPVISLSKHWCVVNAGWIVNRQHDIASRGSWLLPEQKQCIIILRWQAISDMTFTVCPCNLSSQITSIIIWVRAWMIVFFFAFSNVLDFSHIRIYKLWRKHNDNSKEKMICYFQIMTKKVTTFLIGILFQDYKALQIWSFFEKFWDVRVTTQNFLRM